MGAPDLDVTDWRRSTRYKGAFEERGEEHPVVQWFWAEVDGWDSEKRALLLLWCTGSSQVPAQGFDYLQGRDGRLLKFCLTSVPLEQAVYPRAHTCFNRIDVPLFGSEAQLVAAFTFVLQTANAAGFSMD